MCHPPSFGGLSYTGFAWFCHNLVIEISPCWDMLVCFRALSRNDFIFHQLPSWSHPTRNIKHSLFHCPGWRPGGVGHHLPSRQGCGVLPATRQAAGVVQGPDPQTHPSQWHEPPRAPPCGWRWVGQCAWDGSGGIWGLSERRELRQMLAEQSCHQIFCYCMNS